MGTLERKGEVPVLECLQERGSHQASVQQGRSRRFLRSQMSALPLSPVLDAAGDSPGDIGVR